MRNKKLTLDKSVLASLQKDQMAAITGGVKRCDSTQSTVEEPLTDIDDTQTGPGGLVSCCQKSCH